MYHISRVARWHLPVAASSPFSSFKAFHMTFVRDKSQNRFPVVFYEIFHLHNRFAVGSVTFQPYRPSTGYFGNIYTYIY